MILISVTTAFCSGLGKGEVRETQVSLKKTWLKLRQIPVPTAKAQVSARRKYVRGRLRSILRKRVGLKGRGRGLDHQRWQNNYFHAQGLKSLVQLRSA